MMKLRLGVAAAMVLSFACASSSHGHECPGYYAPATCYASRCCGDAFYCQSYGRPFSHGYYYQGGNHYHWRYRQWDARYGCYCYYDPSCTTWYYWCQPDSCYYPVNYCPYRTYRWLDSDVTTRSQTGSAVARVNTGGATANSQMPAQPLEGPQSNAAPTGNGFGGGFAPQAFAPPAGNGFGGGSAPQAFASPAGNGFGGGSAPQISQFGPGGGFAGGNALAMQTPGTPTGQVGPSGAIANQGQFPFVQGGSASMGSLAATNRVNPPGAVAQAFQPYSGRLPRTPNNRVNSSGAAANTNAFPNVSPGTGHVTSNMPRHPATHVGGMQWHRPTVNHYPHHNVRHYSYTPNYRSPSRTASHTASRYARR